MDQNLKYWECFHKNHKLISFKELMFFPQQGIQCKSCMPSILLTTNFSVQFKYLFIIIGEGDCCRCFFCGGGLREWEPGDDPCKILGVFSQKPQTN
jgi:hypothetical protein